VDLQGTGAPGKGFERGRPRGREKSENGKAGGDNWEDPFETRRDRGRSANPHPHKLEPGENMDRLKERGGVREIRKRKNFKKGRKEGGLKKKERGGKNKRTYF